MYPLHLALLLKRFWLSPPVEEAIFLFRIEQNRPAAAGRGASPARGPSGSSHKDAS